ncbi:hypothetical protein ACP4J4_20160 (plasmid) [Aureimonas ureilytica]|uniref:hypothetical protein n=1 Tax=Aureimonas ureilytica TaxID=401562 RepID=UPI003CF04C69
MKTFKESLESDRMVVIWYRNADAAAHAQALQAIEEGQEYKFDKQWTARWDIAKQPNQQDHLHVRFKGRDACVINKDGTPSHKSSPASSLPKHIRKAVMKTGKVLIEEASFAEEDLSSWRIPHAAIFSFRLHTLAKRPSPPV